MTERSQESCHKSTIDRAAHVWQQFAHRDFSGVVGIEESTRKIHPVLPAVLGFPGLKVHNAWCVLCAWQGEHVAV